MTAQISRRFLVIVAILLAVVAAPVRGQTIWYVDDDAPNDPGPGDPTVSDPLEDGSPEHPFDAIQKGVNAAIDGDTVLVADGMYVGAANTEIAFYGRAIVVRSENGPANCIIDCEETADCAFYLRLGEGPDSIVDGFTVTNACGT